MVPNHDQDLEDQAEEISEAVAAGLAEVLATHINFSNPTEAKEVVGEFCKWIEENCSQRTEVVRS